MLRKIAEGLFPQDEPVVCPSIPQLEDRPVPRATIGELCDVTTRMKIDRAPGLDGKPNVVLWVAIQEYPNMFSKTMQKCLDDCVFPDAFNSGS